MCGLVGVMGRITFQEEKAFKYLLQLDTVRGPHSTGVLSVNQKGEAKVIKEVGTPWELFDSKKWDKFIQGSHNLLLGHNRYATQGAINKINAHPFEFEHIIGAHNGTLRSMYQLDDYLQFDVDSEALYHHMNKNTVEDTIKKVNGAFALTWYDKRDATLNITRNAERPMYMTRSNDGKTLFWASEDWMLIVALANVGLKHGDIKQVAPMEYYKFNVPQALAANCPMIEFDKQVLEGYKYVTYSANTNTSNVSNFPKKSSKELSQYVGVPSLVEVVREVKPTGQYSQAYVEATLENDRDIMFRIFAQENSEQWENLLTSPNLFKVTAKSCNYVGGGYLTVDLRSIIEVIEEEGPELFKIYDGEMVTEEQFNLATSCGCCWCTQAPDAADADDIIWFDKENFLCKSCAEEDNVKPYIQQLVLN